jgi:dihydroflavonol-4-reductase
LSAKNVLVTGATGFLGGHLVNRLLKQNHNVSILIRKSSQLDSFKKESVNIFYGDITNRQALLDACQNQDIVYHLAGVIAYKKSERSLMEKVNVEGTNNVIDACITNKVSKLLHLSSVVTIGASFNPAPINEEFQFNLSQYNLGYFETKRKAEELITKAVKNDGLQAYMVNPSTIYGPGDAKKGSRKTQLKVAKGKFKLFPPGGVNVVHVEDVLDGIELCLENGKPGRRYILGGDNLTIKELFAIIAKEANVPPPHVPIPRFVLGALGLAGDTMRKFGKETSLSSETAVTSSLFHWFDNSRAKKELGFQPRSSEQAIRESVQWIKENGLLKNS